MPNLIIGSRGSKLALWQANWVKAELEKLHDGLTVEIEIIKTTGDKLTEASLARMPGKGVFTKEIEEALFERRVDLAVHSLKDLPTTLPDGLHLAAIPKREDPRDALLVSRRLASRVTSIETLPVQPRIGTSSPRRAAQLKMLRPDAQIIELRGNVETRIRKLDEGEFDAIILAAAGLNRLGFASRITQWIPNAQMLGAVGQGALGIETCIEDERTNYLLDGLNHWPTRNAVEAERAVLRGLGGGCAVPIAAFGIVEGTSGTGQLYLEGLVCNESGTKHVRHQVTGSQFKCEELGRLLARQLIADGAHELLNEMSAPESLDEILPAAAAPAHTTIHIEQQVIQPAPVLENIEEITAADRPDDITLEIYTDPMLVTEALSEPEVISQPAVPPTTTLNNEVYLVENVGFAFAPEPIALAPVFELSPLAALDAIDVEEESPAPLAPKQAVNPRANELPLSGKRILVTRARHQADTIAHNLKAVGAEVILCPTIEIRPPDAWVQVDQVIARLQEYDWLAFTSSNGVAYFLKRFDELQHGRGELAGLKICAVGKKTSEKLLTEKLQVDLMPEQFTAESLVASFIKRFGVGQRLRGARILLPAAKATRDVIRPSLEKLGVQVDVVEVYQNILPDVSSTEIETLIAQAHADYVIFTSPSTVNNLGTLLDSDHLALPLAKSRIACIGPVTAKAAEQAGLTVHIQPEEHTIQAIITEIIKECTHSA